MAKISSIKRVLALVEENRTLLKKVSYVLLAVVGLYAVLMIATPKPKMPAEYKAAIDSLTSVNKALLEKQKQIDSTIKVYQEKVAQVDFQINNIKEKTTIVREYYREVGQQASKYTPTQIDSFFKVRYNY